MGSLLREQRRPFFFSYTLYNNLNQKIRLVFIITNLACFDVNTNLHKLSIKFIFSKKNRCTLK